MSEESKLDRHVRLAQKHLKEIEKMGYNVAVGHMELNVYDFSEATEEEMASRYFDPDDYVIKQITD